MPLSVISVQKRTAAGAPLARVRLQFRDYAMEPRAGGLAIEANEDANGKCYSCHPNGVRQLIARRTPVLDARPVKGEPAYDPSGAAPPPPDFAFQRLLEFNRKLRSYGAPDWAGRIRPGDHGPILGAALGCADCHNGVARSALNLSTSLNQVRQKVRTELTMPPDTDLPRLLERQENHLTLLPPADEARLAAGADEAEKLVQAFAASRFTALKEWFLATPCR
jgi:hypothetical protein